MFTNDLKGQGKTIFEEINSAKQVSFFTFYDFASLTTIQVISWQS